MKRTFFPCCSALVALVLSASGARAALIQIVADNDFAVLTGTSSSILRLVYQNNVVWNQQIVNASSFNLTLNPGEDTIYLLGLGGGGEENISGLINGVNINTLNDIEKSSDLSSYLTGYAAAVSSQAVANGTYSASLSEVQTALPNLTWSTPTPAPGTVPTLSGFGTGYVFAPNNAVLFKFSGSSVGVGSAVPEPGTWAAAALLVSGAAFMRWRKRKATC